MFQATAGATINTAAAGNIQSLGFTDFTNSRVVTNTDADNVATTTVSSNGLTTGVVDILTAGTGTSVRHATAATTTDGVTLTWTGSNTAIRPIVCVTLVKGTSVSAVGSVTIPNGTGSTVSITGLAAKPTMIFAAWLGNGIGFGGGANTTASARSSFGIGTCDVGLTQRTWTLRTDDGLTTPFAETDLRNNRIAGELAATRSAELTACNSDGATFTKRDAVTAEDMAYWAVTIPDAVKLGSVDSPTTASADWTVTGPGFQPQFLMMGLSVATAENTQKTEGAVGIYQSDGTRENTVGVSSQQFGSANNSNTQSLVANKVLFAGHDGTTLHDASTLTFNASGWTILDANYTTASATAYKWFYFAVQSGVSNNFILLRRRRAD
ncbi:MAG: hypothetical protein ABI640_13045 [Gammaproteobacteria bacterium]